MENNSESNIQTKIEKIAQAIYLVSNHLKDTEPLKWEIRKESIEFLTSTRSLSEGGDGKEVPPDLVIDALTSCARDLTSYLSLAIMSGLISRNNGTLIINEIRLLVSAFNQVVDANTAKAGFVLSEDFFATDPELAEGFAKKVSKGQMSNLISDIENIRRNGMSTSNFHKVQNSSKTSINNEENLKDKKDERQKRIIALLKTETNLTIKDFVKVINDCSEKTIQRELISLVEKGIVKKEGERRWSTYSLR